MQALGFTLGLADRGMAPFGTVQGIVAAAGVILGSDLRLPSPQRMPRYFDHAMYDAVRQTCLGCRFYINVHRDGADETLLEECACLGHCRAEGLTCLNTAQHKRLVAACAVGHYTIAELEFVLWRGVLPNEEFYLLIGLHGDARDATLRVLMADYAGTAP
jgi:hypothetical protein